MFSKGARKLFTERRHGRQGGIFFSRAVAVIVDIEVAEQVPDQEIRNFVPLDKTFLLEERGVEPLFEAIEHLLFYRGELRLLLRFGASRVGVLRKSGCFGSPIEGSSGSS
jgi:hypothetical protein